jgi:uncharacterized membrane protein
VNHTLVSTWEFGGPLAGLSPAVAWALLALAALLGVAFAWFSYRHALRVLTRPRRVFLITLRAIFLVTLLLCLANPVRVARSTFQPETHRRLAVVVDRSDSMTTPDNRRRSRLDDALRTWRSLIPAAQTAFSETCFYSFATDLHPAASLEAALARTAATGETHLYQALASLLNAPRGERPDALVVLTDGLDTTGETAAVLTQRALAAGTPVWFVAGANRLRSSPFVRVRELRAPATALRASEFTLDGTFEAFSREARVEKFSLWRGASRIAGGELPLNAGYNVIPWSTPIATGEPGDLELVLRLGDTADAPAAARSATRVVARNTIRVLFYQGALDWGFRYLIDALKTDPSFELTSMLNPALNVTLSRGSRAGGAVGMLPANVRGLDAYDFVVLAHVFPAQLTDAQQQALLEFTRAGGGVLFTSPDPEALPQFDGHPLGELLPVVFATTDHRAEDDDIPAIDADGQPLSPRKMQRLMIERAARRARQSLDGTAGSAKHSLTPFMLTAAGRASPVFAKAGAADPDDRLAPRFVDYATVSLAKPGAEVLAVHPTALDPESRQPRILLATQTFGRGRTALLTTDGLWRWKLSQPSAQREVETFWQQLMLWLGQGRERGVRFVNAPAQVPINDTVTVRLSGLTPLLRPEIRAIAPDGRTTVIIAQATNDSESPWEFSWTPALPGAWELNVSAAGAPPVRIFPFATSQPTGELAQVPPALDTLRVLAATTGGALLTTEPPSAWRAAKDAPATLLGERRQPRWDVWPVLLIAFCAYALELILRRRWKLL